MQAYQIPEGRMCIQIAKGLLESTRNAPAHREVGSEPSHVYGDIWWFKR